MIVRTPKKSYIFSLVYESEVIFPLEIQILSLRMILAAKMKTEEEHSNNFLS